MAVLEPFRHIGIGRKLMSFLSQELKNKQVEKVVLHAQFGAIEFYRACGFNESGSPFREAGIKHIKMVRDLG
jgi:predicted GNAT family N-acyltransferase